MSIFDGLRRNKKHRGGANKLHKAWWETADEIQPVDALFYDPAEDAYDPLGSYTGRPADGGMPEQDADDL
jgi:hypothetical protein